MSRNNLRVLIFMIMSTICVMSASFEESEDALLMNAIVSEESGDLQGAMGIYQYLYDKSGKKIYLMQGARDALGLKGNTRYYIEKMQEYRQQHMEDEDSEFYRILVALHLRAGDKKEARALARKYLFFGRSMDDQLALAALSEELGDPVETLRILVNIYKNSPDDEVAIEIARLVDENGISSINAIAILEKHIHAHVNSSMDVYFKLIDLYAKQNNVGRIIELYKEMYGKDDQEYFMKQIVELSLYQKDYDGAIAFLQKSKNNEVMIFSFYSEKGDLLKAASLADELYKKSSNPKWLAESAMLRFEQADLSKTADGVAINNMQRMMNEAISKGVSDPVYLNYYGYILIDRDIDSNRGVELVKKALLGDKNNPYYLDSLAWGQYKLGRCSSAYRNIILALQYGGYAEADIREHWSLIDKCMKKKMNWK